MRYEFVHKGNTKTKLTVAKDRVSIKFQEGLPQDVEDRQKAFLLSVAEQLVKKDLAGTVRGTFNERNWTIWMSGLDFSQSFAEQ